jgi:hypothetical protein
MRGSTSSLNLGKDKSIAPRMVKKAQTADVYQCKRKNLELDAQVV